jgi:transposase InsO family protein
MRPVFAGHVRGYDFVTGRTGGGEALKFLNIIDEYTRECLSISVQRSLKAKDVSDILFYLFNTRGIPLFIRPGNRPEFIDKQLITRLKKIGVKTVYTEPGSPWGNGYIESFNGEMKDGFLNSEQTGALFEAKILAEKRRIQIIILDRAATEIIYRPHRSRMNFGRNYAEVHNRPPRKLV